MRRGSTGCVVPNHRLIRAHGIRARHKRRYKATTDSTHALPIAPNVLARKFAPTAPNHVWTADLTYVWTDTGWPYLAIVLDLFNREVVGCSIKPRMTADLVVDALPMAWFRRQPRAGLVFHSDRGSQYASGPFQDKLAAFGMTCAMSRRGNCWDNAPTESFLNSLKNERVHGIYASHDAARADLFDNIELFYDRSRRHSALDYVSPTQYLQHRLAAQAERNLAA